MPIGHYLVLSGLLFAIGAAGVFLRKNLITLLLSIEIMLNAVNLAFVAFGRQLGTNDGQILPIDDVLRVDGRRRRVGGRPRPRDCAVPPSRVLEPRSLYVAEVVSRRRHRMHRGLTC